MFRALLVWVFIILVGSGTLQSSSLNTESPGPNIVIIFCDDLGYGDLGCYGNPSIRTPNIDQMAREGLRFTEFYTASSVCTPSRAGLLTGRLPIRNGMCGHARRSVMRQNGTGGLPEEDLTVAEVLKEQGYSTMAVGKWHLGHYPHALPNRHGFDHFFGMPWSNDMKPYFFIRDGERLPEEVDQKVLTRRLTDEAVSFIRTERQGPFFLYLAHAFPHTPLHVPDEVRGSSPRGLYGDVVEEIDRSTGRILDTLREMGIEENTLVIFTSDNGPWLIRKQNGGSSGLLRDGKGSTFEGGMRVPAIAWWPNTVPLASVSREMASTTDLLATIAHLSGGEVPEDQLLDSRDLGEVLTQNGESGRDRIYYYRGSEIYAARLGPWKAHFTTRSAYGGEAAVNHDPPLLYHLGNDPGEQYDQGQKYPEVIEQIRAMVDEHACSFQPPPSQLELFSPEGK